MKKGSIFTKEHREKLSLSHLGIQDSEKNGMWKGTGAGYVAIHSWIKRHTETPLSCDFCGKEKTTPKSIQWANKDHKYSRNIKDWMSLCASCHKNYDIEHGLVKVSGFNNPFFGKKHSEESKRKMSLSLKGRIPWNKGLCVASVEEA